MILQFIQWNPSPEIFSIGPVTVRWYGLLFASGFVIGYFLMLKFFKKEGVSVALLDKLTTFMVVATVVGARLGHCLFYEPDVYLSDPIRILKIWEGGLASHGAGIAIIIALYYFSKKTKKPMLWVLDRIVVVTALAGFFIRMGNLMNSEIIGKATEASWGFLFLNHYDAAVRTTPHHPAQLYEALCYLGIFAFLITYYYKRFEKLILGELFSYFLILVFGVRFLIEFIKEPQVGFEENMTLNMGQWLSIPFVLLGIYILYSQKKKLKTAK